MQVFCKAAHSSKLVLERKVVGKVVGTLACTVGRKEVGMEVGTQACTVERKEVGMVVGTLACTVERKEVGMVVGKVCILEGMMARMVARKQAHSSYCYESIPTRKMP